MNNDKELKIAVALIAGFIIVCGAIALALVISGHQTNDTSLSGQIDRAVETQGSICIVVSENGYTDTFRMDTWQHQSGNTWYKYKAHCDGGSVVIEKYTAQSTTQPSQDVKGNLSTVDYYSAANVSYVSYAEYGVTYIWHR